MVAWGTFESGAFSVSRGSLTMYRSSADVVRGHCAMCGTSLTYQHDRRAAEIDITLSTLDEPNAFVPECHIWVQDKLPWLKLEDGLPQYSAFRDAT